MKKIKKQGGDNGTDIHMAFYYMQKTFSERTSKKLINRGCFGGTTTYFIFSVVVEFLKYALLCITKIHSTLY